MSKAAKWTILAVLVATLATVTFALGVTFERNRDGGRSEANTAEGAPDFDALYEIYGLLQRDYVDQSLIDGKTLSQAAINGMVKSLSDTGTYYVDPQTYGVSIMPSGTFEGIGANVTQQDGKIVILSPIKGSPAEAAGIRAGDVILEVDGESTDGWNIEQAVSKIRGPKGTDVRLKVEHSDGKTEEFTVTRDEIKVESVSRQAPTGDFKDSDGNEVKDLAYIQIREFTLADGVPAQAGAGRGRGGRLQGSHSRPQGQSGRAAGHGGASVGHVPGQRDDPRRGGPRPGREGLQR